MSTLFLAAAIVWALSAPTKKLRVERSNVLAALAILLMAVNLFGWAASKLTKQVSTHSQPAAKVTAQGNLIIYKQ